MAQRVKNLPAMQEMWCSIPGSGRSSAEGNGYPLQYSCLENSIDRRAWQTTVHSVAKSQTRLSNYHSHTSPSRMDDLTISAEQGGARFS